MIRNQCILCGIKHCAKAIALLTESRLGYPLHRYLAAGEIAEMESETMQWPDLAIKAREERTKMMEDPQYEPDMMGLLEEAVKILNEERKKGNQSNSPKPRIKKK